MFFRFSIQEDNVTSWHRPICSCAVSLSPPSRCRLGSLQPTPNVIALLSMQIPRKRFLRWQVANDHYANHQTVELATGRMPVAAVEGSVERGKTWAGVRMSSKDA
jgi:hypothetical protein